MYRTAILVVGVGLVLFGGDAMRSSNAAYGQGRLAGRLEGRRERRMQAQDHAAAAYSRPAEQAWIEDNLSHSRDTAVGIGLEAIHENLGRAKTAYDVVQSGHEYFNSGTPGSPLKAMQVMTGVFSRPLVAAGVGPQAEFITKFMETATDYTMAKHDEAGALFESGMAQQHLDTYRRTGNPDDLARAALAARPETTYRQLKSWDTRRPLIVRTQPGMPGQHPNTAVGDLAAGWRTMVRKEPFKSTATNPIARAQDWARWKLDQNNTVTNSSFDRTLRDSDGTTRVQIQRQQTGWGYEPGETRRYEQVRTEFHGRRVETYGRNTSTGAGRPWSSGGSQGGSSRPSFGSSGSGRLSFSTPSVSRH